MEKLHQSATPWLKLLELALNVALKIFALISAFFILKNKQWATLLPAG